VLFLILILFFFWPKPSFNDPAQGYGPKMGREPWKGNHSPFFFFLVFANSAAKVDRPKEMESDPRRKKKIPKKEKHI